MSPSPASPQTAIVRTFTGSAWPKHPSCSACTQTLASRFCWRARSGSKVNPGMRTRFAWKTSNAFRRASPRGPRHAPPLSPPLRRRARRSSLAAIRPRRRFFLSISTLEEVHPCRPNSRRSGRDRRSGPLPNRTLRNTATARRSDGGKTQTLKSEALDTALAGRQLAPGTKEQLSQLLDSEIQLKSPTKPAPMRAVGPGLVPLAQHLEAKLAQAGVREIPGERLGAGAGPKPSTPTVGRRGSAIG